MFEGIVPPRGRVVDTVYTALRRAIIRHELPPGHRLSIPALAAEFGVSRSPVREAVLRLVREGLATEEPHRGASVIDYREGELAHLYEVREALEALAASRAATYSDGPHLERLEGLLAEESEAIENDDMEEHIRADMDFHTEVLSASRNPVLQEVLQELYGRMRVAMLARVSITGPRRALEDHRQIYHAIRNHDAKAASNAASQHVSRVLEGLERPETS